MFDIWGAPEEYEAKIAALKKKAQASESWWFRRYVHQVCFATVTLAMLHTRKGP